MGFMIIIGLICVTGIFPLFTHAKSIDCSLIIGDIKLYEYSNSEVRLTWKNNNVAIGAQFKLYITNRNYNPRLRSEVLNYENSKEQLLKPGDISLYILSEDERLCQWDNRGKWNIYSDFIKVEQYAGSGDTPAPDISTTKPLDKGQTPNVVPIEMSKEPTNEPSTSNSLLAVWIVLGVILLAAVGLAVVCFVRWKYGNTNPPKQKLVVEYKEEDIYNEITEPLQPQSPRVDVVEVTYAGSVNPAHLIDISSSKTDNIPNLNTSTSSKKTFDTQPTTGGAVYAVVQKNRQIVEIPDNDNGVTVGDTNAYAVVQKTRTTPETMGDEYQNNIAIAHLRDESMDVQHVPNDHEEKTNIQTPSRFMNPDNLVYLEVDFNKTNGAQSASTKHRHPDQLGVEKSQNDTTTSALNQEVSMDDGCGYTDIQTTQLQTRNQ